MTYVSLFSGICAATAAWKPLGMEPLAFAEIEPFPSAMLAHRYPGVPNLGDVSAVDWSPYRGLIDVVVGGSPCQAFSVAGLRKSLEDPRGNLTLEYVRAVHAIRPRYAVWENVPGVLSTNDNAFGCFLGALVGSEEAIMAPRGHRNRRSKWVQKWFAVAHDVPGKRRWRRHEMLIEWTAWSRVGVVAGPLGTACWRILDAQYFGLAQRRERVFVVFSPGGGADPGEILLEWESMRRDSPPSRAQGKGVTRSVAQGAGSGSEWPADVSPPLNTSWADRSAGSQAQEWDSEKGGRFVPDIGFALNAKGGGGRIDGESETFVAHGFDASEDGTGRGTPLVPVANTLKANNGGGGFGSDPNETFVPMAFHENQRGEITVNDTAGSLKAGGGKPGQGYPAIAYNLRGREGGAALEPTDVASVRAASGGSSRSYVLNNEQYSVVDEELFNGIMKHADAIETDAATLLRGMRQEIGTQAFSEWGFGVLVSLHPKEVLRSKVHGEELRQPTSEVRTWLDDCTSSCPQDLPGWSMLEMREAGRERRPPPGWKPPEQLAKKLDAYLSQLPYQGASPSKESVPDLRETTEGKGVLQSPFDSIQEIWRSVSVQDSSEEEMLVMRLASECARAMWKALHAAKAKRDVVKKGGQGFVGVRRLTPL